MSEVNAKNVREVREGLGLSRGDVAEATGLTVGRVAGIELGKKLEKDDVTLIIDFLSQYDATSFEEETTSIDLRILDTGSEDTVLDSWNGLTKGDAIKVAGQQRAKFEFLAYVQKANGTSYVSAIGGKGGRRSMRAFDPELVSSAKKTRTKKLKGSDIVTSPLPVIEEEPPFEHSLADELVDAAESMVAASYEGDI